MSIDDNYLDPVDPTLFERVNYAGESLPLLDGEGPHQLIVRDVRFVNSSGGRVTLCAEFFVLDSPTCNVALAAHVIGSIATPGPAGDYARVRAKRFLTALLGVEDLDAEGFDARRMHELRGTYCGATGKLVEVKGKPPKPDGTRQLLTRFDWSRYNSPEAWRLGELVERRAMRLAECGAPDKAVQQLLDASAAATRDRGDSMYLRDHLARVVLAKGTTRKGEA